MNNFFITDNTKREYLINEDITLDNYEDILHISNITIEKLCKENPNLLIFPKKLNSFCDDISDKVILNTHKTLNNKVVVSTSNTMGFIGYGNTKITIKSRFSKEKDFFMQYMLQKVFSLNLFDLEYTLSNDGEFELLLFTFPYFLNKALSQGLYKNYQTFKRNDSKLKGVIELNRHIKCNEPFVGNIAYNSRESTYDNQVTQLIRHTIEYLKLSVVGKSILNSNLETKTSVKQIVDATPTYNQRQRQKIINKNLKVNAHPFFSEYKYLIKLCLMILNHKKLNYGNSTNKVYGVLFDGAWLWEEYLATILRKIEFTHAKNKEGKNGIPVYSGRMYYPDFYIKASSSNNHKDSIPLENYVLDAKYKHLNNSSISRDDLNQLITYMYILPATQSALIYPYQTKLSDQKLIATQKNIFGMNGVVHTFGVPIPQNIDTYSDFKSAMAISESLIINNDWT